MRKLLYLITQSLWLTFSALSKGFRLQIIYLNCVFLHTREANREKVIQITQFNLIQNSVTTAVVCKQLEKNCIIPNNSY